MLNKQAKHTKHFLDFPDVVGSGNTFIFNISLKLFTISIIPSFGFGALQNGRKEGSFPSSNTLISYAARGPLLTRGRWKAEHIEPYLSTIALDTKTLDKLLLKYARALADKDGSWYTARAR
jgi:hypothetical protein